MDIILSIIIWIESFFIPRKPILYLNNSNPMSSIKRRNSSMEKLNELGLHIEIPNKKNKNNENTVNYSKNISIDTNYISPSSVDLIVKKTGIYYINGQEYKRPNISPKEDKIDNKMVNIFQESNKYYM
jgi:hypothetical protein